MTRLPVSPAVRPGAQAPGPGAAVGGDATEELDAGEELFAAMLEGLAQRVSLFVFRGFFEPLLPLRLDDRLLTLAAPSAFHRDWLRDHYSDLLEQAASECLGGRARIAIVHDERLTGPSQQPPRFGQTQPPPAVSSTLAPPTRVPPPPTRVPAPPAPSVLPAPAYSPRELVSSAPTVVPGPSAQVLAYRPRTSQGAVRGTLNPRYTFESFITGHSNRMAFAACEAVAEHPASKYSPLFLFGGTGLGKTHLLHAIGNALLRARPDLRIVYMSAEEWVNEYIKEIRQQRFDEFRARYRSGCDILLLDDIQFLAGKDASQDEFFHTFNSLHASGRQIVVTSDRYPHEIEGLEERLKTRLQWGLIADVQPPDMETRVAILQQKAEALGLRVGEDLAHYLANHISRSVRELEGALWRLQAYTQLTGEMLTLEVARDQLRGVVGAKAGAVTCEQIMKVVGAYYDVRPQDLRSKSRQRQLTLARQVAMYLARKHVGASLPEIGRAFGGRDHTTVLSSVRKIEALMATDAGMQAVVGRIERALHGELP